MSEFNFIFYSENCQPSKILMKYMEKEGLLKYFHLINIDNNPHPEITHTPTLLIKNQANLHVGKDAFIWLEQIKQWKITNTINNFNKDDILGFCKQEMNSQDIYAYIKQDIAFPQNFVEYNDIEKEQILVPPEDKRKLSLNEQKKAIMQLERERIQQDKEAMTNRQNLINKISNNH